MAYRIALMRGDGIGPEISEAALLVLEAASRKADLKIGFIEVEGGDRTLKERGVALPEETIHTIRSSDGCLKAPVGETGAEVVVRLRRLLDLYANIRPAFNLPNVPSVASGVDLVIVRENTEDLYLGYENEFDGGAMAIRVITERASERIAKYAFRMAEGRNRMKKVTAVHKINVLKKSCGVFALACRKVASRYPGIAFDEMLVDAAAMNLIRNPQNFDVIVTTNLFGDILSDEAAQIVGGLGICASANIGEESAIFEPVHGSAPDIAGKGIANPISMIQSSRMMLEWLGNRKQDGRCVEASESIRRAMDTVLNRGLATPDLGGRAGTMEFASAVTSLLK